MATLSSSRRRSSGRGANVLLWIVQVLLALVFLFAGVMKLRMSGALLAQFTGLPGSFMHFIALAEIAGALGLVLPGIFRVARGLTPIAAVGLVTIMAGATTLTVVTGPVAMVLMPFTVGLLAATVAHRRRHWLESSGSDQPEGAWVEAPFQGD